MKTILLSVLFLLAVDVGFNLGLGWGLFALGVSYCVARYSERRKS